MTEEPFIDRARSRIQMSRINARTRGQGAFDSLRQGVQGARSNFSGLTGRVGFTERRNRIRERLGLQPVPEPPTAVPPIAAPGAPDIDMATTVPEKGAADVQTGVAQSGQVAASAIAQQAEMPTLSGLIDITGQEAVGKTAAEEGIQTRSTFASLITQV